MSFDALSLFGLFAVGAMLVRYALEDRSPRYVLGFAAACAGVCVRVPAGRVAVRSSGGRLDRRRATSLAVADSDLDFKARELT